MTNTKIILGLADYSFDFLQSFSYCLQMHDSSISIPILDITGSGFTNKFQKLKPFQIPNIVVIDTEIPFDDGIRAIEWVSDNYPETIIVASTNRENLAVKYYLSRLNVKTYLIKSFWALDMVHLFYRLLDNPKANKLLVVR